MTWHFVSSHSSQGPVVDFWDPSCLDGVPSALLKLLPTAEKCCSNDKLTDVSIPFLSGMTSEHSMADHGADTSISSPEGSHVRTSAQPVKAQVSQGRSHHYGSKWLGWFARFDLVSCSWKTPQTSLLGESTEYSGTWPRWGMMRNGACWGLDTLMRRIGVTAYGYWQMWPTPKASQSGPDFARVNRKRSGGDDLATAVARWPTPTFNDASAAGNRNLAGSCAHAGTSLTDAVNGGQGRRHGQLNPSWVEWLMGWPEEWTDLKPLAMDKFRAWLHSHGRF